MTRPFQMLLFLAVATSIFVGIHYYFYKRLVKDPKLNQPHRNIAKWLIVLLGLSAILTFPLSRILPIAISRAITLIPYVWMGMMVFLMFSLIAFDLAHLLVFIRCKAAGKGRFDSKKSLSIARLKAMLAIAITIIIGGAALVIGQHDPAIKRTQVKMSKLTHLQSGIQIAQITDLHINPISGKEWLKRVVDRVNGLKPDLIVITGDLVDGSVENLSPEIEPISKLKAPYGVFFITGNHEYYSGAKEWIDKLGQMGIRVLMNKAVIIGKEPNTLTLVGIDDGGHEHREESQNKSDQTANLSQLLANIKISKNSEAVLLIHNPRRMLDISDDRFGLVLSGHTHGGQFWPFSALVGIGHPYFSGMYRQQGRTKIYVSEGTGLWGPPMRLGTKAEITLITLVSN